jgi:hypothetical protein
MNADSQWRRAENFLFSFRNGFWPHKVLIDFSCWEEIEIEKRFLLHALKQ